MRPRPTADANKLECSRSHARASADFRRHSRDHQSSISVYWPQDDEFTVTRASTALTRPKLMLCPGDDITDTLRGPPLIQIFFARCD